MTIELPPASILTNTAEVLEACELAEISGTASPHSFHLVTQLASLLLLGKYNHARHLWRRYNTEIPPDSEIESSSTANRNMSGRELDLYQFHLLWKAAQPLLRSYFGQNMSLLDSSAELFASLQSCVDANLHPLSLYAKEVAEGMRSEIANLMETIYDTVQEEKCKSLLGIGETKLLDQFLVGRGWDMREGSQGIWIPASCQGQITSNGAETSNIELLSNIVSFMERKNVQKM